MTAKKRIQKHMALQILLFAVLVALDQISKYRMASQLQEKGDISLIPGVLEFHYLENSGAAFGIFQGRQWLFYILTIVILGAAVYIYVRFWGEVYRAISGSDSKRIPRVQTRICILYGIAVLCAGAVGNLIDRVVHGYVIDFIHVLFLQFPVFNIADICVTISCIFIVIMFIFGSNKEDDRI